MTSRRNGDLAQATLWILAGIWALGWVWWAQTIALMAPCELCFWERWPYRALIVLGIVWLLLVGRGASVGAVRILGGLVTLTLLAAIAVSALHVGVEQGWWPSPLPACAAPHFRGGGTLAQQLAAMPLRPGKPCDSPNRLFAWLPVSMTTLDLIYAVLLLVVGRLLLPRWTRTSRRVP